MTGGSKMLASFETRPIADTGYGADATRSLPSRGRRGVFVGRMSVAFLALLALFTFSIGTATSAEGSSPTSPTATWTRLSPSTSPPARDSASIAYDPATGNTVLFGGSANGSDLNDTWTFNGTTWTHLSPATSPPARSYASMAYDPATGNMVLFGGSGVSSELSDTWTFNGTTWSQLSPAASPRARDGASMAYDPATGNMVLFGGEADSVNLSDTWSFNGTTWARLSPATSAPARWYASIAYDAATQDLVLFGGSGDTSDLSDTWTFNGTTWTELAPATSPPVRDSAFMDYDPVTGNVVLFGGSGASSDLSDTWTFNGTTWTQLSPPASPLARDSGSMAYDLATGKMVLFGGEANSVDLSDTWTFVQVTVSLAQASPTSAMVTYGAGYSGQSLAVTNSTGTVSYTEATSSNSADVIVSSTGAIRAATSLVPGTYTVSGSETDTNGDTGTWVFSLTVGQASQTITFTSTPPSNAAVGATYTVTATGGASGNVITFSTTSVCTVSGSTVSFVGVGKCVVDANQAGSADYLAAPQVQQTINVGKAPQTITFTSSPPSGATVGSTYTLTATGGPSGNAVTFTTSSVCTVSGSTVSFTGVGECVIDANQAGDADYLPAPQVQQKITVGKAAQTITFTSRPPSDATVGVTYTVTATGGPSRNAVTFTTSSVCTVSGSTVSFIGVGECVIDANQAGDADYLPAPQVQQTIAVGKGSQTITFTSKAPSDAAVGATYTVTASGGASGQPVTFSTTSMCTVSGSKVHFIGVGKCVIEANQAGDTDYLAADRASESFRVVKATSKIALRLSAAKVIFGKEQVERFSVTVAPQFAGSTPTGRVTIRNGSTVLCTTSLSSGKATCRLSPSELKAGTYRLVAAYRGGTDFNGSSSAKETLTVTS
ncbi:MAG: kelch repeat-containing protein [Acidimicrobiales bacterium]